MRELRTRNIYTREAPTLGHQIRVFRHRTLRWFQPPIRAVGREEPESSTVRDRRFREDN
jgi:hypothetical protein